MSRNVADNVTTAAPWGGSGGGIYAERATLENTTVSMNEATGFYGGGIYVSDTLTLTGVTVAFNAVAEQGGGVSVRQGRFANTLIANNSGLEFLGPDCAGTVASLGYILIGYHNSKFPSCHISGDTTGNLINVDARLAPLADNGGPTETHGFLPGSPALDGGNCFGLPEDQRGMERPADQPDVPDASDGCDIGAYEDGAPPPTPTATATVTATPSPVQTATITATPSPSHTATATLTPVPPQEDLRLFLPMVQRQRTDVGDRKGREG